MIAMRTVFFLEHRHVVNIHSYSKVSLRLFGVGYNGNLILPHPDRGGVHA